MHVLWTTIYTWRLFVHHTRVLLSKSAFGCGCLQDIRTQTLRDCQWVVAQSYNWLLSIIEPELSVEDCHRLGGTTLQCCVTQVLIGSFAGPPPIVTMFPCSRLCGDGDAPSRKKRIVPFASMDASWVVVRG